MVMKSDSLCHRVIKAPISILVLSEFIAITFLDSNKSYLSATHYPQSSDGCSCP